MYRITWQKAGHRFPPICADFECQREGQNYMSAGDVGSYYCDEHRGQIEAALAAPDLLTACIDAESETPDETHHREGLGIHVFMTWEGIDALRAAISKAEGGKNDE